MDPQPSFCPNLDCASRGAINAGNLRCHDSLRNRWKCRTCGKTFSGRKGTPFYHLKSDPQLVVWVLTLLAYGCPPQAIVAAFGLDERTVATWQQRAGQHCEAVQADRVQTPHDHTRVQADEIRVRCQRRQIVWVAMAMCATTRLWLGAVVSPHRDKHLARSLARKIYACLAQHVHKGVAQAALLVVTDGWTAYHDAFVKTFRTAQSTGKRGRPRLLVWPHFVLGQTVKWQAAGRTLGIRVCHLAGNTSQIGRLLPPQQVLATAYIERLNATFRQRLAGLCRRSRCLLRSAASVQTGTYLVGTVYNFCTPHQSLTTPQREPRTPAMAAGVSGHIWSVWELLAYQVAPPPYVAPKKRGRPPGKRAQSEPKGADSLVTV